MRAGQAAEPLFARLARRHSGGGFSPETDWPLRRYVQPSLGEALSPAGYAAQVLADVRRVWPLLDNGITEALPGR